MTKVFRVVSLILGETFSFLLGAVVEPEPFDVTVAAEPVVDIQVYGCFQLATTRAGDVRTFFADLSVGGDRRLLGEAHHALLGGPVAVFTDVLVGFLRRVFTVTAGQAQLLLLRRGGSSWAVHFFGRGWVGAGEW